MKWLMRRLVCLYPRWWRDRYAAELEALVEDAGPGWGAAFDLTKGAMTMHARSRGTLPLVAACAGLAIGVAVYLRAPELYESSATIRVSAASATLDALRDTLAGVVTTQALRDATALTLIRSEGGVTTLRVSHWARDAGEAQAMTAALAAAIGGTVLEPPARPTFAQRSTSATAIPAGAVLGLVIGGAAMWLRRAAASRRGSSAP
jgi:uncharacterized protein involved in exopolysaccharide biosynthesis